VYRNREGRNNGGSRDTLETGTSILCLTHREEESGRLSLELCQKSVKRFFSIQTHGKSRSSSVGIATVYGLDDDRVSGVRFPGGGGLGIFLLSTVSRPALGPTQPPIQWVQGALSLGVKRPGRQADHSPLLMPRSRLPGAIPPPQYIFMAWC
jgi:hypothetical protein